MRLKDLTEYKGKYPEERVQIFGHCPDRSWRF
jgi:hypothetical protein